MARFPARRGRGTSRSEANGGHVTALNGNNFYQENQEPMNRFTKSALVLLSLSTFACVAPAQSNRQRTAGKPEVNASAVQESAVHEIQLTAKKYEFTPGTIHVKKGERVRIVITATDHDHGFKLDEFNIDQKIKKETSVTVEFTADHAGTFPFKCSTFCGFGHGKMKGTLIVDE
jgi:cytochrome c oxidase subunit 2